MLLSRTTTRGLTIGILGLQLALGASAATVPLYVNNTVTNNPQIDATTVINGGTIISSNSSFNPPLFQTANTLRFTNQSSGTLNGNPGFRFKFITNSFEFPMQSFHNQGAIVAQGQGVFFFGGTPTPSGGNVQAYATNLTSPGSIDVGSEGLIHLEGKQVNVSRGTLLASGGTGLNPGFSFGTTYLNPGGVLDNYWGTGTNEIMTTNFNFFANPIDLLSAGTFNFVVPFAQSPTHEVAFSSGFNGLTSVPNVGLPSFDAFVYTNAFGPGSTNRVVEVVFLATNAADTNFTGAVQFADFGNGNVTPVVQFSSTDTNPITGTVFTNTIYMLDRLATLTNTRLSTNFSAPTFRPEAYEVSLDAPFEWFFSGPANSVFGPGLFFQAGFSNRFVNNFYAAYSAQFGTQSSVTNANPNNPALGDPTNRLGRVEIFADNLNMNLTRIRAENTAIVTTSNLVNTAGLIMDAPIINYNLTLLTNTLSLSGMVPTTVKRFNGSLSAWSGSWTNRFGPLLFQYHVWILDASQLKATQPVALPNLTLKGTNVIMDGVLSIFNSLAITSDSITFSTNNQLLLSSQNIPNLSSNHFPGAKYWTNNGIVNVAGEIRLGTDRPAPYSNIVNHGTIGGISHSMRAQYFENSGTVSAGTWLGLQYFGGGGALNITANSAKLQDGVFLAGGDILIQASDLKFRNYITVTPSVLNLVATNSLTDNGSDAGNFLQTGFGFNLSSKPAFGDLLGTTFQDNAAAFANIPHSWAGQNRGADKSGFTNNVAIGKLVLNGGANSLYSFSPAGASNAMYVDFLDFEGATTNNPVAFLDIAPNFVLYFAGANVPVESLDGQVSGRLRWVKNYAGPNSGVDVVLPNGQTTRVNAALLDSASVDSDADGIVNKFDLSPFDGIVIKSTVKFTNSPTRAIISWDGAANTVYLVEYATTLVPPNWTNLLNYTNSATTNGVVTIQDTLPAGTAARYYRISYTP